MPSGGSRRIPAPSSRSRCPREGAGRAAGSSFTLGRLLAEARRAGETRSDLEADFRDMCREEGLPMPLANVLVQGYEVDAYWPAARLVVELDGWGFHRGRAAFERDRARDAALKVAGVDVIRVTDRRMRGDRAGLAEMLRDLIARTGGGR